MKNTMIVYELENILYEMECNDGWISSCTDDDDKIRKEHNHRKKALREAIKKLSKEV